MATEPDVRAITGRAPYPHLVAAGAKTIWTMPRPTDHRGDVLLHAAKCRPRSFAIPTYVDNPEAHAPPPWNANLPGLDLDNWFDGWESDDGSWWSCDYRWGRFPLGAVVAVARLADCVPITRNGDRPLADHFVCPHIDGSLTLYRFGNGGDERPTLEQDVSDQAPLGDFSTDAPRWAWLLTDVRPIDPVPAKGHGGLWRPSDELVAACMEGTTR